jgi:hypothetical protein
MEVRDRALLDPRLPLQSTRGVTTVAFRLGLQPSRGASSEVPSGPAMISSKIVPSSRLR